MGLNFGQNLFPPRGEMSVNYDYFDVANGTGYEVYYGAKGDNGEYLTVTEKVYSEDIASFVEDQAMAGTSTKYFDLDFNINFNMPKNVKGKLYANIPIGVAATNSTDRTMTYYAICKAVHYDGSTETVLATGTSKTITTVTTISTGKTSFSSEMMLCVMDISTMKHFKKGETLRIIVEGWFACTSQTGANMHLLIGHDPMNRNCEKNYRPATINDELELANEISGGGTVQYQNTQMTFQVPFKLDI